jgi:hypothetical protein
MLKNLLYVLVIVVSLVNPLLNQVMAQDRYTIIKLKNSDKEQSQNIEYFKGYSFPDNSFAPFIKLFPPDRIVDFIDEENHCNRKKYIYEKEFKFSKCNFEAFSIGESRNLESSYVIEFERLVTFENCSINLLKFKNCNFKQPFKINANGKYTFDNCRFTNSIYVEDNYAFSTYKPSIKDSIYMNRRCEIDFFETQFGNEIYIKNDLGEITLSNGGKMLKNKNKSFDVFDNIEYRETDEIFLIGSKFHMNDFSMSHFTGKLTLSIDENVNVDSLRSQFPLFLPMELERLVMNYESFLAIGISKTQHFFEDIIKNGVIIVLSRDDNLIKLLDKINLDETTLDEAEFKPEVEDLDNILKINFQREMSFKDFFDKEITYKKHVDLYYDNINKQIKDDTLIKAEYKELLYSRFNNRKEKYAFYYYLMNIQKSPLNIVYTIKNLILLPTVNINGYYGEYNFFICSFLIIIYFAFFIYFRKYRTLIYSYIVNDEFSTLKGKEKKGSGFSDFFKSLWFSCVVFINPKFPAKYFKFSNESFLKAIVIEWIIGLIIVIIFLVFVASKFPIVAKLLAI